MSPRHDTELRFPGPQPPHGPGDDMNRNGFSSRRGRFVPPWRRWAFPLIGFTLLFAAIGVGYAYLTRPYRAAVQLFAYERTFSSQAEAADFVAGATSTGSIAKLTAKLPKGLSSENLADRCQVTVDQGHPYIGASVTAPYESSARALIE